MQYRVQVPVGNLLLWDTVLYQVPVPYNRYFEIWHDKSLDKSWVMLCYLVKYRIQPVPVASQRCYPICAACHFMALWLTIWQTSSTMNAVSIPSPKVTACLAAPWPVSC